MSVTASASVDSESRALAATLGGTVAMDHLLAMGTPIQRVVVVHLSAKHPRIRRAVDQLDVEIPVALIPTGMLFSNLQTRVNMSPEKITARLACRLLANELKRCQPVNPTLPGRNILKPWRSALLERAKGIGAKYEWIRRG